MCPQCHELTARTQRGKFCPRCGIALPRPACRPGRGARLVICVIAATVLIVSSFLIFNRADTARRENSSKMEGSVLSNADTLWQSGERDKSVESYKAIINDRFLDLSQSERTRAFERVIGRLVERGGPEAAADYLDKAILFGVPLSLDTPEGNRAVAEARRRSKTNGNWWTDTNSLER